MAIEKNNSDAMYDLGYYYHSIEKDYDNMKKYYLMAIEKGNSKAMNNLGYYYQHVMEDYDNMKKYYIMAVEKNNSEAMFRLGMYYYNTKDYDNMKKYYIMAIEKGNSDLQSHAMYNLGFYYEYTEKDYDNMKKYYLMAIEKDNDMAIKNLERIRKAISQIPDINVKEDDIIYTNELVKRITCYICRTHEKNTVFNCGHSTCFGCSQKIETCGLCKTKILTKNQLFI